MPPARSCVVLVLMTFLVLPLPASWADNVLDFVGAQFDGVAGVDGLDGADSVAVSPDGKHVYVASMWDDAVAVFARDGLTGELTFLEAELDGVAGVDGLDAVQSVAVSPDGKHVYAASEYDDAVAVFARDSSTGELTFVEAEFDGVAGVDGLNYAQSVAVSPDGAHVYVASYLDHAVAVFARDGSTGALTFVEAELDGVAGVDGLRGAISVVVSPDGGHVYVAGFIDKAVAVFARDGGTGELTFVEAKLDGAAGVDGLNGAASVAVAPDGAHVYVASQTDRAVAMFTRDAGTGALTFLEAVFDWTSGVDGLNGARSAAVSRDGAHVYVAGSSDDALAVFVRDLVSGALTFVEAAFDGTNGVDGLDGAASVTVSPDGAHVYVASGIDDAVAAFWSVPTELAEGNERYFAQDYAGAEQYYSSVISAIPAWAVAYNNRGLARCKQLDFSGARDDFDQAKVLDALYVAPYLNQGKCLAMQRDLAGARTQFQAGLAIDPDHVKLLFNLGWVEAEEGRYDEALASYSSALAEDPAYLRAMVASGVALAGKGESSSAVNAFYEAINTAEDGDLFAAISAYNLQLLRGPGVSFDNDTAAQDFLDGLFDMRAGLFSRAADHLADAQYLAPAVPDIPWLISWCRLRQLLTTAAASAYADARAQMPVLEIDSSNPSQLFIDGIFRGNTPQTVSVLPSQFDVAFRRSNQPRSERAVVAYADGTPGGASPIDVTLVEVSGFSLFSAVDDSDSDWLGDAWEMETFGDLREGPLGDSDGDGVTNLEEYWANTDPGPGYPRLRRRLTTAQP